MENKKTILTSSFDRFLKLLKTKGPQTSAAIAAELGITGEGARFQLLKLLDEGLVETETASKGKGRPYQLWRLTSKGNHYFPDMHADFSAQLLTTITEVLGQDAMSTLILAREKSTIEKYSQQISILPDLRLKIATLCELRNMEGYLAEWVQDEEGFILIENHCPINSAAKSCDGICQSELNVIKTVLGETVNVTRTHHILAGERRCAYRITSKP